jgi:hypothetical protein
MLLPIDEIRNGGWLAGGCIFFNGAGTEMGVGAVGFGATGATVAGCCTGEDMGGTNPGGYGRPVESLRIGNVGPGRNGSAF